MTELAFLGTGVMGAPMALRLNDAGFVVHAYNRTADKARALEPEGVQAHDDPRDAAAGCPLMVTMLSQGNAVLDVAARALAATDPPDTWIQMSTIGPPGTERCAALADDHDVTFVDGPVLGTRAPAQQGELVILASGPESARPAVDPQVFFDAVEGGALDLPYARLKGPAMVKRSFDDVSFALSLARKDAELVLAAADEAGLALPVMSGALARLQAAERDEHGDEDMAATYLAHPPGAPSSARS